jgi:carbamoyl-phosphate synthase large subunit
MKPYNILVTGVSGIIGYGVVEAVRTCRYECSIIGIDMYDDAVGRFWCDAFEKGEPATSDRFAQFIRDMIIKYDIDLVIPCIEAELEILMENRKLYEKLNVAFVLNNDATYRYLHDKSRTYELLKGKIEQIPTIKGTAEVTYGYAAVKLGVPFILKKCVSYASQGVVTIAEKMDFDYWSRRFADGYICQKRIVGEGEYTISVFGTGAGEYVNMIVLSRTLAPDGTTGKARCIDADVKLSAYVDQLCKIIHPVGPTNIQLIEDEGNYLLLEVNPRFSSSTSIRSKFGVNEAEMCIEYFLLGQIPAVRKQKRGRAVRYKKDYIEYDSDNL